MNELEFLKPILGEELFAQVVAKLEGVDNLRLVNAADGSFVSKEKMEQLTHANNDYKKQIAELNKKLGDMQTSAASADELKKQLSDAQASIAAKEAEIREQSLKFRVKDAVRESRARNADLVLRSIDMSKISEDNGNLIGLSDQLEALKKSDGYLFADEPGQSGGVDPHQEPSGEKPSANSIINAAIRQAAGY